MQKTFPLISNLDEADCAPFFQRKHRASISRDDDDSMVDEVDDDVLHGPH